MDKDGLQQALEWVSTTVMINEAYISRETGKIYWVGDGLDADEEKNPDDLDDLGKYVPVPDKRDLDLGTSLAFDYTKQNLPEHYPRVREIFRKRGAYGRFKDLLDEEGLLEEWYAYCESRESETLAEWCKENGFEISTRPFTK